ncbi:LysR substrate-binding domain-containing protein [Salipiger mucosus]|uniref:Transcriptional regulator, LysR family protein n=1 Tax=Salipiger mucosus DSM 16094 TaxID=1123237 RepID=S9S9G1_9RHOB|nr:LysR substrate-binding domain-containing protein [Salipiger mucosus]EPX86800.1 Transcriptional regulator, LysR family protein [Salipiger mucosus DSM 16094]
MHQRKLPPFPALRAFESAARLGSFKDAAEELCVTPSAISHQVRVLETYLDRTLFVRGVRQTALTDQGRSYLSQLTPLLDMLDASTRAAAGETFSGRLRIKSTEGFSKRWLMPRLHRFLADYPDVEVSIETGMPPTEFRGGALDLVIHWGDDPVEGVIVDPFMSSTRVPVCSQAYLDANPDIRRPEDLLRKTLIRDEVADGWEEWFGLVDRAEDCPRVGAPRTGQASDGPPGGPVFAHCELTMSAAENGLGVGLAYKAMMLTALERGDLVMPFDLESPTRTIYSVAYEEARSNDPVIVAFRDWLFETILHESEGLAQDDMVLRAAQ